MKKLLKWSIPIGIIILCLTVVYKGIKGGEEYRHTIAEVTPPPLPPSPPPIQTEGMQLINEYINNEVRANDNYKNHILKVTARVSDIAETDAETGTQPPMVLCSQHIIQGTLYEIACRFKNRNDINKMNIGNTITFDGECRGILNGVIVFTNCALQ